MHTTLQSGSPKPVNGPNSTSQIKTSSDNVQNGGPSFPSRNKRKKREHGDHGTESIKRERSSKRDYGDSIKFKADNVLKSEIANITVRGGLVDFEGVEKLVKLMRPVERKIDLISRSMLVGALAGTDKFDCLTHFLHLKGLPILDTWLQDIRKGKIDVGRDGDRSVDEFLLVLLRALDKLPVNLHSLQTCNIGRSVNHLRTNKNLEVQKKARSLVDTWKKRVEAEMNIIETKSGSFQALSSPSRHGGRSEISRKSSGAHLLASKSSSPKPLSRETATKSASSSGKEGQFRISVAADLPSAPAKEEKSSSSSQSHTRSQSISGKEDARSSTAGSMSVDKMSGGTSRHRKSISGGEGPAASGVQRGTRSNKTTLLHSTSTSERLSGLTCEKAVGVPTVEGKNQKLIVKIPSLSTSGGLSEDPTIMNSRASSPLPSEKDDRFDCNVKEKSDAPRVNVTSEVITESWQSNDFRDVLTGSDDGDVSPADVQDEEDQSKYVDDVMKPAEVAKVVSLSARDDVGMNLLASVAAGEMPNSKCSPTDSSGNPVVLEDHRVGGESKVRFSSGDGCRNESGGGGTENKEKLGVKQAAEHHEDTSGRPKMKDSASVAISPICNENVMTAELCKHLEVKTAITTLEDIQEHKENGDDVASHSCGSTKYTVSENHKGFEIEQVGEFSNRSSSGNAGGKRSARDTSDLVTIEGLAGTAQKTDHFEDPEAHVRFGEFKDVGTFIDIWRDKHACRTANASHANDTHNVNAKLAFDLNEGCVTEEAKSGKPSDLPVPECTSSMRVGNPLPFSDSSIPNCLPASVTVAAASKGPFVPVQELLCSKGELGWKGSATTSAFRPAEPRKVSEISLGSSNISLRDATGCKNERPVFDFDLNVADDSLEDMVSHDLAVVKKSALGLGYSDLPRNETMGSVHAPSSGRFELDLNSVVEVGEMGQYPSTSGSSCFKTPFLQTKSASSRGGLDLNGGPVPDDDTSEPLSFNLHTRTGLHPRALEIGNYSSWSPSGNPYSTLTGPVFHGMGNNKPFPSAPSQKPPGPSAAGSLTTDLYRGPLSPAVPYPATSFQYPIFPFGTNFPPAAATFSAVSPPVMDSSSGGGFGHPGANSYVQRPYLVPFPDGGGNGGMQTNLKWSMQGLDLNAEGRDEKMIMASRRFPVANSETLVGENARMRHLSGGNFKRKGPEGSSDTESSRHKQFLWQ